MKMRTRVIDELVVNMVDVGEETGELDTMLYKVADTYDDEVNVMTEGLTRLDRALADLLPRCGRRLYRDCPVHAAGQYDQ
jgi:hypothetical protein